MPATLTSETTRSFGSVLRTRLSRDSQINTENISIYGSTVYLFNCSNEDVDGIIVPSQANRKNDDLSQSSGSNFRWTETLNPFQRIQHLSDLEPGWCGVGSRIFQNSQIRKAMYLASGIHEICSERELDFSQFMPFIAPSSDGLVLLEWAGKRFENLGKELEVFVLRHEDFNDCEYLKCSEEEEEEGFCSLDDVFSLFDWLLA